MKNHWETVTDEKTAFERCGLDFDNMPSFDHYPEWYRKRAKADYILCVGARAFNTDKKGKVWEPDWTDGSDKWFLRVWIKGTPEKPKGGRVGDAYYGFWYSDSYVGSHLVFPEDEQLEAFYNVFQKYHEDWHLN